LEHTNTSTSYLFHLRSNLRAGFDCRITHYDNDKLDIYICGNALCNLFNNYDKFWQCRPKGADRMSKEGFGLISMQEEIAKINRPSGG